MKGQIKSAKTPAEYLDAVDPDKQAEMREIDAFIRAAVPKLTPMVLNGLLGYGPVHIKYATGRELDWFKIGLASNKGNFAIYICAADEKGYLAEQNAGRLGKVSCGKSCIRFKKWADVDHKVMKELLKQAEKLKFGL